ncbi:5938_t:CDS:2 [Cetraspora pellucida]|uniref:5938_t:CDS:1 n=1 Tax=Cetraspora pellucida TaxID=1433469 RepID=A0ACA9K9W3_9GLOM|nr:5938_t:CDS:2 [Cetraspora pellucida]
MATTKTKIADDAGSNNWLKERAAISAAHRRQKTDPAVARLIEKADQLHKERTQKHLQEETVDDETRDNVPEPNAEIKTPRKVVKNSFRRSLLPSPLNYSAPPTEDDEEEDIDAIVSVPPPEEIVVKVSQKTVEETSNQTKEYTEEIYRSFAESVLEQGLTTDSSLELSFDLKPEDIKQENTDQETEEQENTEQENAEHESTELEEHESAELVCAEQESVEQEIVEQESVEQESTDQESTVMVTYDESNESNMEEALEFETIEKDEITD